MAGKNVELTHDIDYDDLERHDLLTGEQMFTQEDKLFTYASLGLSGLAGLLCLVAMILTWVLYFRERTRTFLWHAIWLIFAMLFAFACAGWAAMAAGALGKRQAPNPTFTLIIFVGSLIFAVYCIAIGFWLVFYRHNHFAYIVGLRTDNGLWDARMKSGSSFEDGWKSSRRMMWWVTFFTFISGFVFALVAYTARSVVWNRYQLTRIGLFIACLGMVLAGFLMVYWAEECYEYQNLTSFSYGGKLINVMKALGIAGIILGAFTAVANLLRFKNSYFILGLLLLVFMFLCVCGDGSLWREINTIQLSRINTSCDLILQPIHESSLEDVCINGGKYLNPGQQCTKQYLANRWEAGNTNEVRSLNPSCCQLGLAWYNLPFMQLAFWGLIMILSTIVAAACCFYLSDTSEYLSNAHRPVHWLDYILFALPILLIIAFVLYFIFRKANSIPFGTNSYVNSFQFAPGAQPEVSTFPIVPQSVLDTAAPPANQNGCFNFTTASIITPAFNDKDATCSSNCIERVALSSSDSNFNLPSDLSGATLGSSKARQYFFPNCNGGDDSNILLYGTNQQLKDALNKIRVCPKYIGTTSTVRFVHDQVTPTTINVEGLRTGEDTTVPAAGTCAAGFTDTIGPSTCNGTCKYLYTRSDAFIRKSLKGSLYYINGTETKTDIHPEVTVKATTAGGSTVGGSTNLLSGGIFVIDGVPRYKDSTYNLLLTIEDPKNVFVKKVVEVFVDRDLGAEDEISAGKIRLLTSDGNYCSPTNTTCITARQNLKGSVKVMVSDAGSPSQLKPLPGVSVAVTGQHVSNGVSLATFVTDNNGNGETGTPLDYGAYTVTLSKAGFKTATQRIDLQSNGAAPVQVLMTPTDQPYAMRVVADMNEPNADFDLSINMDNGKGAQCTVSPYNKYCPYSAHLSDVAFGTGQEMVAIRNLSVANYAAVVGPSPAYVSPGSCNQATVAESAIGHYASGSWNWDDFKKIKGLQDIAIKVRSLVGYQQTTVGGNGVAENPVAKEPPVETPEQALVDKIILAIGGVVIPENLRTKRNSVVSTINKSTGEQLVETMISKSDNVTSNLTGNTGNVSTQWIQYKYTKPNYEQLANKTSSHYNYANGTYQYIFNNLFNSSFNTSGANGVTQVNTDKGYNYISDQLEKSKLSYYTEDNYTETQYTTASKVGYLRQTKIVNKGDADTSPVESTLFSNSTYDSIAKVNVTDYKKISKDTYPKNSSSKTTNETRWSSYGPNDTVKTEDNSTTINIGNATTYNETVTKKKLVQNTDGKTTTDISSLTQAKDKDTTTMTSSSTFSNVPTNTSLRASTNVTTVDFKGYVNKTTVTTTLIVSHDNNQTATATNYTTSTWTEVTSIDSNSSVVTKIISNKTTVASTGSTANTTYTATIVDDLKTKKRTIYADGKTTTEDIKRRILASSSEVASHAAADSNNYMLISCFTGYGDASLLTLNRFFSSRPTANDNCQPAINSQRPDFTIAKLADAVKNAKK